MDSSMTLRGHAQLLEFRLAGVADFRIESLPSLNAISEVVDV